MRNIELSEEKLASITESTHPKGMSNEYTSKGNTLTWKHLPPFSLEVTLKGKNLFPLFASFSLGAHIKERIFAPDGSNLFPLSVAPILE